MIVYDNFRYMNGPYEEIIVQMGSKGRGGAAAGVAWYMRADHRIQKIRDKIGGNEQAERYVEAES